MYKGTINKIMCLAIFTLSAQAAKSGEVEIPMVGQADDGSTIEVAIPESEYSERLKGAISGVEKSTLVALSRKSEESKPWMLRSVVVGLGLNMEVKLGPLIKFGALPRFRLGFSNAKEPSIP